MEKDRKYEIISKTAADGKSWRMVVTKTWRGTQFVSKHKTLKEARQAIEWYKDHPPLIGYVITPAAPEKKPQNALSFASGQEMYDFITKEEVGYDGDLYNGELEQYVFLYNGTGSICVYSGIDREEATELAKKVREHGDYWAAFLGWQGSAIYDTPDYENNPPETNEALEWCEGCFNHPAWQTCEDFAREVLGPTLDEQIREAANRTATQSVNAPEKSAERE